MSIQITFRLYCDYCCDVSDGWSTRQDAVDCTVLDGWNIVNKANKKAMCPACQRRKASGVKVEAI